MGKASTTVDVDASVRKQPFAALERAAKEAGHKLAKDFRTCELADGNAVVTAPIARADMPSEAELTAGVDLLYAYVALPEMKKLKPGFYLIRIATSGFDFAKGVRVAFIDAKGKSAHSLQGSARLRTPGAAAGNVVPYDGKVCGRKKCFHWHRVGWGDWEFGCTDTRGNTVDCMQPL